MTLSEDTMLKCSEHLSTYKSACEDHPYLKSFDSELQQRTNKVIDSLTLEAKTGSVSQHAVHIEVSKHLVDVSQSVANLIIESETDVWENKTLRSLVNAYFDSTMKTLEIFNTIKTCVQKAELGQLLIEDVVEEFEKESAAKDDGGEKKYEKTLKLLKEFKEMGDPFNGQVLTTQFKLIKEQQESLLQEVSEAKKKLQEEIDSLEKWEIISHVVFGAAFAIVAVASIALIVTGVGAVAGMALALTLPLIALGWVGVKVALEKKIKDLEKQLEALGKVEDIESSVEKGTEVNEEALGTITVLVEKLEDMIKAMLQLVDHAIKKEENEAAMRRTIDLIKKNVDEFTDDIEKVGENVDTLSNLIIEARNQVLEKIIESGKH